MTTREPTRWRGLVRQTSRGYYLGWAPPSAPRRPALGWVARPCLHKGLYHLMPCWLAPFWWAIEEDGAHRAFWLTVIRLGLFRMRDPEFGYLNDGRWRWQR